MAATTWEVGTEPQPSLVPAGVGAGVGEKAGSPLSPTPFSMLRKLYGRRADGTFQRLGSRTLAARVFNGAEFAARPVHRGGSEGELGCCPHLTRHSCPPSTQSDLGTDGERGRAAGGATLQEAAERAGLASPNLLTRGASSRHPGFPNALHPGASWAGPCAPCQAAHTSWAPRPPGGRPARRPPPRAQASCAMRSEHTTECQSVPDHNHLMGRNRGVQRRVERQEVQSTHSAAGTAGRRPRGALASP